MGRAGGTTCRGSCRLRNGAFSQQVRAIGVLTLLGSPKELIRGPRHRFDSLRAAAFRARPVAECQAENDSCECARCCTQLAQMESVCFLDLLCVCLELFPCGMAGPGFVCLNLFLQFE